jgi:hypothetical protein
MAIAPNSTITLYNVPWDDSYKHICDAAMSSYLPGQAVKTLSNYTYIQKDYIINVDASMDEIKSANYVVFKNASHENRLVYNFIVHMEYINDRVTALHIKTDVYQTWRDRMTVKNCLVIREHVNTDTIGLHTVPEGLETGDYIFHGATSYQRAFMSTLGIVIAVTEYWDGAAWQTASGNEYNGIFSGVKLYNSTSAGNVSAFLDQYVTDAKTSSVVAVYLIPQAMYNGSWNAAVTAMSGSSSSDDHTWNGYARPSTIDGYTPKNNKLLTYPYLFFTLDNNSGAMAIFKYEDFQSSTPAFTVYGGIMPNPSYKCFPTNMNGSNGAGNGLEYGITMSGYPLCAWASDSFAQWLAGNAGSLIATGAGAAGAIIAGAATGNLIMVGGGVATAISQLTAIYNHSIQPDQMHGSLNSGSANVAKGWQDFYCKCKCIKAEYARIIDEFFTMYGYKVNRVKTPNLTGRTYWNYVQTNDCIITGAIPYEDKIQLEQMFNRGVTIWHSGSGIGNYSQDNGV